MLDRNNLKILMKTIAKANPTAPTAYSFGEQSFSLTELNETLRAELNEYSKDFYAYEQHKPMIYALIAETIDDVLPKKVTKQYEALAETKTFANGSKPVFKRKINAMKRIQQFVTKAALAGVYEVAKLGKNEESFEVPTHALGAAIQVGYEEFLDGRVDFNEMLDAMMEGFDLIIYEEIGKAMAAGISQLPAANQGTSNGFDEKIMDGLVNIARTYGEPTIYCTAEFAAKMVPNDAWMLTDAMKTELWNNNRLATYKGTRVVVLDQGFTDETNAEKVIDPGYAWIIPNGANSKPVKIAFEGPTMIRDLENADWSKEIQCYKKVGVVCMMTNNICVYKDTALQGKMNTWDFSHGPISNNVTVTNIADAKAEVNVTGTVGE